MRYTSHNPIYWVIVALCVALVPQLASMPAHLVPITLVPIAWRVLAEVRGWRPLHFTLRILLTALGSFALVITYGSLIGRRAAVSLLALMLSLKLLEAFKVRDQRVVASLSLFLCATQFLFSQDIPMFFYGLACLVSSLAALTLLERSQAFKPVGRVPATGLSVLAELRFSARLLTLALPIALVVFLFFPRWGSPLWGVPEEALDAKTGLSDSMTPGSIQGLFMDDSPAFRARFNSVAPPRSQWYWRGPVFWHFDGKTWESSYYGKLVPTDSRPPIAGSPWYYTVQLEPSERNWYFALDYPAIVPDGVDLTMDYQLYAKHPITQLRTYDMVSNPNFTDSPKLRPLFRAAALELPPDLNPRTRQMMQQWHAETPDDRALISRVLTYFHREDFHYTLDPAEQEAVRRNPNTVDEFLFQSRRGFCEHYASAFTVMMRMAGIPARVVTGYQGGWYSDFGNYVLVRQSDAHAWSEVWLPGDGWTRVDPTAAVAPSRVETDALAAFGERRSAFDFAWIRSFRNGFDVLERYWNDWVIRFDAKLQDGLFRPFGIEHLDAKVLVAILAGLIAVLAAFLVPLLLRLRSGGRPDRAARAWAKFRKRLEAAGVRLSPALGPMELAEAAGVKLTDRRAEIESIADMYARLRYAPKRPGPGVFEAAVRHFRA